MLTIKRDTTFLNLISLILLYSTPSLSLDSLKLFQTSVCDNEQLIIKCPQHTKIVVDNVFYGRSTSNLEKSCRTSGHYDLRLTRRGQQRRRHKQKKRITDGVGFDDMDCEVTNARMRILEKCQNKIQCRFLVNPRFFSRDPCPLTRKYLQLSYKCRPSEFISEAHCEGTRVELQCLPDQALTIVSAIYGRKLAEDDSANCATFFPNGIPGYNCQTDVLRNLRNKCQTKPKCFFNVTDRQLKISKQNTACSNNVGKHLTLVYMCVDRIVFDENFVLETNDGEGDEEERFDFNLVTETASKTVDPGQEPVNDEQYEEDFHRQASRESQSSPVHDQTSSSKMYNVSYNGSGFRDDPESRLQHENGTSVNQIIHSRQWTSVEKFLSRNKSTLSQFFYISAASGALIIIFCFANKQMKKYCNKEKQCSSDSSISPSSNSSVTSDRTIINGDKYDANWPASPLPTVRQYYLTEDKGSVTVEALSNQKKRSSSITDSRTVQDCSTGFYKPVTDRALIDYMAIGSPLATGPLFEDEYYV